MDDLGVEIQPEDAAAALARRRPAGDKRARAKRRAESLSDVAAPGEGSAAAEAVPGSPQQKKRRPKGDRRARAKRKAADEDGAGDDDGGGGGAADDGTHGGGRVKRRLSKKLRKKAAESKINGSLAARAEAVLGTSAADLQPPRVGVNLKGKNVKLVTHPRLQLIPLVPYEQVRHCYHDSSSSSSPSYSH